MIRDLVFFVEFVNVSNILLVVEEGFLLDTVLGKHFLEGHFQGIGGRKNEQLKFRYGNSTTHHRICFV